MVKSRSPRSTPIPVNLTVGEPRKYLLPAEVETLIATARKLSRHGHRDATMILIAYRHGLRASELVTLEWHQIELDGGRLHVRRAKNGTPSVHPIRGDEIRELRRLKREQGPSSSSYVFISERGAPMTAMGFYLLIQRLGKAAAMPFPVHPHMLRHACGYKLANDGHDTRSLQHWLGHKNISNTTVYTAMSPDRFKDFWR
jgi:type 1 fimbriae regulatory protein FimB/type 1 fimbriae regulatory protein FimE